MKGFLEMGYKIKDTGTGDAYFDFQQLFNAKQQEEIFNILNISMEDTEEIRGFALSKQSIIGAEIYMLRCLNHPEKRNYPSPSHEKKRIKKIQKETDNFLDFLKNNFAIFQEDYQDILQFEHKFSNRFRNKMCRGDNKYSGRYLKKHDLINKNAFDRLLIELEKNLQTLSFTTNKVLQDYKPHVQKHSKVNYQEWSLISSIGNIYFKCLKSLPKINVTKDTYGQVAYFSGDFLELVKIIYEGHRFKCPSDEAIYKKLQGLSKGKFPHPKLNSKELVWFAEPEWIEKGSPE